ncbi:FtsH protease activity modulator HflK [Marinagarivorans algicola]|uniref:FtsH protease activity modulator HflK n=1 Tax=Marinagarivorans algicola TaxID=1513270 RepID=UPI0006B92BE6|nr:FtsH protease activity modulator HflK [Marinagarivorans algicola]
MAWNEPGNSGGSSGNDGKNNGGDNEGNKDPWGNRNHNNNSDGPPDFDEIVRNLFGAFTGKKGGGNRGGGGNANSNGSLPLAPMIILVAVIAVVTFIGKGFGVVNEQERAVVLRFGSYVETKGPGLRWNPPLIDKVFTENVTRVRLWSTQEEMLTKDLNIVDIKLSVQYSIDSAEDFILRVKSPIDSLQQAANSALRHVVGSALMHDVLTEGRAAIAIEVRSRLQEYLNAYTTGILVDKVNIEDSNPPKQVQGAFDDVIKAREDEERFQNEAQSYANGVVPQAEGESARMIEAARAYKDEVIARAEGEANRFELLLTEYKKAPEVTRQRLYLEAVQEVMEKSSKVMVDVEGGNNMMYVPLDKLMEASNVAASEGRRGFTRQEIEQLTNHIKSEILNDLPDSTSRRSGR